VRAEELAEETPLVTLNTSALDAQDQNLNGCWLINQRRRRQKTAVFQSGWSGSPGRDSADRSGLRRPIGMSVEAISAGFDVGAYQCGPEPAGQTGGLPHKRRRLVGRHPDRCSGLLLVLSPGRSRH
jgi:hypothetical protein